ncbi:MAG: hypothetical protein H6713_17070 [Myxococcales bacterium]|nr:hypothetical protein [Myxococcales bacterium]
MNLPCSSTTSGPGRASARGRPRGQTRRARGLSRGAPPLLAALLGLACAPLVLSCTGSFYDPPYDESEGELGNGDFRYRCLSSGKTDAACLFSEGAVFPGAVAIGAPFEMDYSKDPESEVDSPATLAVQPAAERMISRTAGVFTPHEAGYAALLALSSSSDVVDVIHLRIAPIARVAFWNESRLEVTKLSVSAGWTTQVAAVPFDTTDELLSGSLPFAWTIEDEAIAVIETEPSANLIELRGVAGGVTTLTADIDGVQASIEITVLGGAATTSSASDTDSDSGTTTDGDTDATTGDTDMTSGTSSDTDMTSGTTDDTDATTGTTGPLLEPLDLDPEDGQGGQP